jgi:hypothetical protein
MAAPATTQQPQRNGATSAPPTPKLTLARVSKGKVARPLWTHLYGPEGMGKSTFGARAPEPIFIDAEDGTANIDTTRFVFDDAGRTKPKDWPEVLEAIRTLDREEHPYRTLVLDTVDALEALIWAHICKRDGKTSIEDYGFGKGYVAAVDEWRLLIAALERIRAKGMNVITLGHSIVKAFHNPEGDDFDR